MLQRVSFYSIISSQKKLVKTPACPKITSVMYLKSASFEFWHLCNKTTSPLRLVPFLQN